MVQQQCLYSPNPQPPQLSCLPSQVRRPDPASRNALHISIHSTWCAVCLLQRTEHGTNLIALLPAHCCAPRLTQGGMSSNSQQQALSMPVLRALPTAGCQRPRSTAASSMCAELPPPPLALVWHALHLQQTPVWLTGLGVCIRNTDEATAPASPCRHLAFRDLLSQSAVSMWLASIEMTKVICLAVEASGRPESGRCSFL